MAINAQSIITRALALLGLSNATTTEVSSGLFPLQLMVDSFNAESSMQFYEASAVFTLTPGTTVYTIGNGATFNAGLIPIRLDKANILVNQGNGTVTRRPIRILDPTALLNVNPVSTTLSYPEAVYLSPALNGAGYASIIIPQPFSQSCQIELQYPAMLSPFPDLATSLILPPSYAEMLVYNLEMRLASDYGRTPKPQDVVFAQTSLQRVRTLNHRPITQDPAARPRVVFDRTVGEYVRVG